MFGGRPLSMSDLNRPPPSGSWTKFVFSRVNHCFLGLRVKRSLTGVSISHNSEGSDNLLKYVIPFICSASNEKINTINEAEVLFFCIGHYGSGKTHFELKFLTASKLTQLQNLFMRVLYSAHIDILFAKENAEVEAIDYTESIAFHKYPVSQVFTTVVNSEEPAREQPKLWPHFATLISKREWLQHRNWKIFHESGNESTFLKIKQPNQVIYTDKEYE